MRRRSDDGQSTVELALGLPLVMAMLLLVIQVGLVARDQVLVAHAVREAVRAAAVDAHPDAAVAAAKAAGPLDPGRLDVAVGPRGGRGSRLTVGVSYRSPTNLPLVGDALPDVVLNSRATMRVEK